MPKRIGLTILLFLFLYSVSAQEKWNYPEVDRKSYELYEQKKWADLIDFASAARKNGIDFFYLQVRTGIAFYNLEKYNKSISYFRKAWETDNSQEWLQEYLYYSLLFSGRSVEASKIARHFSESLKRKIDFQNSQVIYAAAEVGYSFNPDFNKLKENTFDKDLNIENDYGEAFLLKNYLFESVDFNHRVAPGFGFNHNFTHLNVNRLQQVDWGQRYTFDTKTNQNQYFINPYFVLGKKIYLSPSFNITWGNFNYFSGAISNSGQVFREVDYKFSDYIFSVSAFTYFGNFAPGAEINFANIYDSGFSQFSGWITFYPLSNTKLYITPRVYFKNSSDMEFGYNTFGISGGFQIKQVHFYGQYLNGDMENFVESGGYVIANFPGRSTQKIMASLYFPTGKKYRFVIRYINQDIFEKYNVYSNGILNNSLEYKYIKHTLTAGLLWNF